MRNFLLLCGAVTAITTGLGSGATAARPRQTVAERGEAELARALDGLVPGKPVRCMPFSSVLSTQVIGGVGLVYDLGNGRKFLNRPQSGANWLDWNVIPVTTITGGSLCKIDSVRLLDRGTGMQGGFVILDDFVPYTRPDKVR